MLTLSRSHISSTPMRTPPCAPERMVLYSSNPLSNPGISFQSPEGALSRDRANFPPYHVCQHACGQPCADGFDLVLQSTSKIIMAPSWNLNECVPINLMRSDNFNNALHHFHVNDCNFNAVRIFAFPATGWEMRSRRMGSTAAKDQKVTATGPSAKFPQPPAANKNTNVRRDEAANDTLSFLWYSNLAP